MSTASSAELQLPGTFIYFSTSPVFKFPGSCSDDRSHLRRISGEVTEQQQRLPVFVYFVVVDDDNQA